MARTIHCLYCGVPLNLPAQAEGRKVRCPKCEGRFQVPAASGAKKAAPPAAPAHRPDSTFELSGKPSSEELSVIPTAEGDLRETFDLPMMTEAAAPAAAVVPAAAQHVADATALFRDAPVNHRRKTGAEARAQARRCPTCGGVVGVGMSVCQTCGLDLETGMRVGLEDDLAPPPAPSRQGVPIPLAVVGGLCLAASVALAVVALVQWHGGLEGAQYFVPVAGFGVFAAVQFLRGKSVKLLLVALTLGAAIDLVGLIALPIYNAQAETQVVARTDNTNDPDVESEIIRPVADRLDLNKLKTGFALLAVYAGLSRYLLSRHVQRYFRN
jgi:hypothetical protein